MKKNILIIDDSALMRRVECDIINADSRFQVSDVAKDGLEALELLLGKKYDAVVCDINMPKMTGLELLKQLQKYNIKAKVIIVSTLAKEGARETILALELGAFDFVTKPDNFIAAKGSDFRNRLILALEVATKSDSTQVESIAVSGNKLQSDKGLRSARVASQHHSVKNQNKIIALACSTGGPRSLQSVIPLLPSDLNAAIVLVQHMPVGFTGSLAQRLNELSKVTVKEAEDGEIIKKGFVYIAPGGSHLKVLKEGEHHSISISSEPPVGGLRPCANLMYDSLVNSSYDEIVCVILTGMGSDGTEGIKKLSNRKATYVIAQDKETSVVYGMPKVIAESGLVNEIAPLEEISQKIIRSVGVK